MKEMENLARSVWRGTANRIVRGVRHILSRDSVNFLSLHYTYLICMSFLGAIICVSTAGLQFIDALFFSVGAATQSGLNTVDVDTLNYAQQITLYMIGNITNPIVIHTFVVFFRLRMFERRFQSVVKNAQLTRRTRSRANTRDLGEETEKGRRGVDGRQITIVGNSGRVIGSNDTPKIEPESSSSSEQDPFPRLSQEETTTVHRNITFADNMISPTGRTIPTIRSPEHGNSVHERQKHQSRDDGEVLRIPGPRESDRGQNPETVRDETQSGPEYNHATRYRGRFGAPGPQIRSTGTQHSQVSATGVDRGARSRANTAVSALSGLKHIFTGQQTLTSHATSAPYLSWQPTIGRNSAFVNLNEEQREELGGIEYRALKLLWKILLCYFFGWHLFGVITFLPWILHTEPWGSIVDATGSSRIWWAFFTSATLFNDLGFTLTPDSFISFQGAVYILLIGGFLIVIGNTGFPCLLRFIIWLASLLVPSDSAVYEELRFLLDHPRRCFTLLFPAPATWLLFGILIALNTADLVLFVILDLNSEAVTSLSPGLKFVDGLFQAVSTRTAGTQVINLSLLHAGIQVSYMIMMYISVFPIAISVRRTNVYEESSLGIYTSAADHEHDENQPGYITRHLQKQLGNDVWFIVIALFIIAIVEGNKISADPAISVFAILFEIVSAYGTVGLSLGYPTVNASLSSQFSVISKLVITAAMMRGRHRGLPYRLDRAVMLPSDELHAIDDHDAAIRHRRGSNLSQLNGRSMDRSPTDGRIAEDALPRRYSMHLSPHRTDFAPRSISQALSLTEK